MMRRRAILLPAALFALPRAALAHEGRAPAPHDLWTSWNADPLILLGLAFAAWAYGRGVRSLWRRAGPGRGVPVWRARAFAGALLAVFVALVTPLDPLGEALFSAHMVQHLVLTMVAAPLFALGAPVLGFLWAIPLPRRRALGRWWRAAARLRAVTRAVTHPVAAWLLSMVAFWAWHVPSYYDAAVEDDVVHALEHVSFLATALLFWWALVNPAGRFRHAFGAAVLYIFTAAMQSTALGALLTLSERTWYAAHLETTQPWGLSPLEDQQIAGAIMWVPASVVYLVALGLVFVQGMRSAERRLGREEGRTRGERPGSQGSVRV